MKQNKRIVIIGPSGSGKSELGRYIVEQYPGRALIIDRKETFVGPRIEVRPEHLGKGISVASLFERFQKPIIYPREFQMEQYPDFLGYFAKQVRRFPYTLLVVDEAHLFQPRHGIHMGESRLLWTEGRHDKIHLLFITQMPVELDIVALKQANVRLAFKTEYPAEASLVAKWLNVPEDRVMQLPEYGFLYGDLRGRKRTYAPEFLPGRGHRFKFNEE